MLQVKKSKRGIDNIFALLRYTYPKSTRVFTPSHITVVSAPMSEATVDHNMEVTVTGISEVTTGEVVLPYRAFDLTNCDCPSEIAAEMFSLTHVKAFLATKPVAIDELLFTKEDDSYRVTATEGAFTVFGEKIFTLAEDPDGEPEPEDPEGDEEDDEDEEEDPEPEPEDPEEEEPVTEEPGFGEHLILHSQGDLYLTSPKGSIEYSIDEKETWQQNTASSNFTISLPSGVVSTVYIKSNDDVVDTMTNYFDIKGHATNTSNFKGVHQWWESSRPIMVRVQDNPFYVPNSAPPNITDMSTMFYNANAFNQDISNWDVSKVTDMADMFRYASSFNGDISNWDVGNVTDMSAMFSNASAFNSDISNWDVSNVTDMQYMFNGASVFNSDLSSWCVSRFTSKPYNFDDGTNAWTLRSPIWGTCPPRAEEPEPYEHLILYSQGDIDLSAPIGSIFYSIDEKETWHENITASFTVSPPSVETAVYIKSNDNLSLTSELQVRDTVANTDNFKGVHQWWESSRPIQLRVKNNPFYVPETAPANITNMEYMFYMANAFNGDISQWDVSKVTNMSSMFRSTSAFNQDISNWDVGNVTDMRSMFNITSAFNQDLSSWDVSSVTNMQYMFASAKAFNQDLSSWCVSQFTSKPNYFDDSASAWTLPRPVWGTCPQPAG